MKHMVLRSELCYYFLILLLVQNKVTFGDIGNKLKGKQFFRTEVPSETYTFLPIDIEKTQKEKYYVPQYYFYIIKPNDRKPLRENKLTTTKGQWINKLNKTKEKPEKTLEITKYTRKEKPEEPFETAYENSRKVSEETFETLKENQKENHKEALETTKEHLEEKPDEAPKTAKENSKERSEETLETPEENPQLYYSIIETKPVAQYVVPTARKENHGNKIAEEDEYESRSSNGKEITEVVETSSMKANYFFGKETTETLETSSTESMNSFGGSITETAESSTETKHFFENETTAAGVMALTETNNSFDKETKELVEISSTKTKLLLGKGTKEAAETSSTESKHSLGNETTAAAEVSSTEANHFRGKEGTETTETFLTKSIQGVTSTVFTGFDNATEAINTYSNEPNVLHLLWTVSCTSDDSVTGYCLLILAAVAFHVLVLSLHELLIVRYLNIIKETSVRFLPLVFAILLLFILSAMYVLVEFITGISLRFKMYK